MPKKTPITLPATITVYLTDAQIKNYKKFKEEVERNRDVINGSLSALQKIANKEENPPVTTISLEKQKFQEYTVNVKIKEDGYSPYEYKNSFDMIAINDELAITQAWQTISRGNKKNKENVWSLSILNKTNNEKIYDLDYDEIFALEKESE